MKIAIDFDGVIHDPKNRLKGYKMGQPIPGAPTFIKSLHDAGHYIIIFPVWADSQQRRQALVDWLNYFKVPFDDITSIKPDADLYIDNNGYRFDGDWAKAFAFVESLHAQT